MTYAALMQSAVDNWPEDEAHALYEDMLTGPESEQASENQVSRQITHMHNVFTRTGVDAADSADLIARFDAALATLRARP